MKTLYQNETSQHQKETKLRIPLDDTKSSNVPKISTRVCDVVHYIENHSDKVKKKLQKKELYTHHTSKIPQYLRNPLDAMDDPVNELSRWTSTVGIYTLQERCMIPPHADPTPALQKRKGCLVPLKAKLCDPELKKERGKYYDEFHYGNVVKLAPIKRSVGIQELGQITFFEPLGSDDQSLDRSRLSDIVVEERSFFNEEVPGWVVYIKDGHTETSTTAYKKFMDSIRKLEIEAVANWMLEKIEHWMYCYAVPIIAVECDKVIQYCLDHLSFPLSEQIMLDCIFNRKEVKELIVKPGQKFKHPKLGKIYAANLIQFAYRHYRNRRKRKRQLLELRSSAIIKRYWRTYCLRKRFWVIHQEKIKHIIQQFDEYQKEFLKSDQEFLSSNRFVIYICPSHIDNLKSLDIARTFPLYYNPSLRYILVPNKEIPSVREQVAGMYDCVHFTSPLDNQKLNIIVPEVSKFLPDHFPNGIGLFYSLKSLELIKEMTKKRDPIVVADEMTPYIAGICAYLNCPFMGSSYDNCIKMQNEPAVVHDWLGDFDVPVTSQHPITLETQNPLEKFASWLDQSTSSWRYRKRIDHRLSQQHEYLSQETMNSLRSQSLQYDWYQGGVLEQLPCCESDYKIVEVGLQIDPNRKWKVIGSNELRMSKGVQNGMLIPQCILDPDNLFNISASMVRALLDNSIYGYITFQCIVWRETDSVQYALSDCFPYLTLNILKASSLAAKCRLVMDESTFKMKTKQEMHWKFPYLSKFEYTDNVVCN
jgi:hypothetical protein